MRKFLFVFLFLLLSTRDVVAADSINVEQIAFDYFISRLDSFSFESYSNYRFNREKDKIYFSGTTELFDDLLLGNFKTYVFKKKKFINAGSFNDRNKLLSCTREPRKIVARQKFVSKGNSAAFIEARKETDALIAVSNRYFFEGYYYVRIKIDPGLAMVQTYFYIKMTEDGEPVDWVVASDIE
ncbi:MAG: hypothetical protein EOP49_06525 [Sphingobacteriales bacterium]|nr:MAG: hypothetical protein EOP49_06525 [Sphingobacteriales bacterium]